MKQRAGTESDVAGWRLASERSLADSLYRLSLPDNLHSYSLDTPPSMSSCTMSFSNMSDFLNRSSAFQLRVSYSRLQIYHERSR
jgi:hypothetical protein